jgi:hypothetical protein
MISPQFVIVEIGFKKIGEKEKLQNGKHDNELNEYYLPQGPANSHLPKTVSIKTIYPFTDAHHFFLFHKISKIK